MNEQHLLNVMAGKPVAGGRLLRGGLRLLSWPYAGTVWVRNRLYDAGLLRVSPVPVPVISIGNLTTGGTGKTPVVALVVRELQQAGLRPGIVSRGYRSLDDNGNDERRVLELLCPDVPHVQNRDRVAAVRSAAYSYGCNVIVADDAFQHRRLDRVLDVVLIDATNPWGYGAVLPRGLLRESRSGLKRADLVLVTRADLVGRTAIEAIQAEIRRMAPLVPCGEVVFRATGLRALSSSTGPDTRENRSADLLSAVAGDKDAGRRRPSSDSGLPAEDAMAENRRVVAFAGVGNPDAFRHAVEQLGWQVSAFRRFPDHWHYTRADAVALQQLATEHAAKVLVTTLKDLVKLRDLPFSDASVFALDITAEVTDGADRFRTAVLQAGTSPTVPLP